MSLYYKRANKYGAIAGIFTGGIIAGTWDLVNGYITDVSIPAMVPGFFISLFSIYIVSVLTADEHSAQKNRASEKLNAKARSR